MAPVVKVGDDPAVSYTRSIFHAVFVCHRRRRWLDPDLRRELYSWFGLYLFRRNSALWDVNGVEDHVHALMLISPRISVAEIMAGLKSSSSRMIHEKLRTREFVWQDGYAAFSVSPSQVEGVKRYLAIQEEHHRRMDVREELKQLLRAHGMEPRGEDPFWREE